MYVGWLCLVLFGGAACGRIGFDDPRDSTDGGASSGLWGTPQVLSELGATGEEDPSLSADRLVIVWSSDRAGNVGSYDLLTATRPTVTSPFENIRNLTELNTVNYDGSPELSPDGLTLYFTIDTAAGGEVYMATRASRSATWSAAVLRADLSSAGDDFELAVSPDELTALVNRAGDFYELTRPSTTAMFSGETLRPELHVANDVASPTIDNGGRVVYFHANAPRDLYVARRSVPGAYSLPSRVEELDTPGAREADPFISADETYMAFGCGENLCEVERR